MQLLYLLLPQRCRTHSTPLNPPYGKTSDPNPNPYSNPYILLTAKHLTLSTASKPKPKHNPNHSPASNHSTASNHSPASCLLVCQPCLLTLPLILALISCQPCLLTPALIATPITGSYDKSLMVWDVATGQCLTTMGGHNGQLRCLILTITLATMGGHNGVS